MATPRGTPLCLRILSDQVHLAMKLCEVVVSSQDTPHFGWALAFRWQDLNLHIVELQCRESLAERSEHANKKLPDTLKSTQP